MASQDQSRDGILRKEGERAGAGFSDRNSPSDPDSKKQ